MTIHFKQLISAIASAVLQAQHQIRQAHISDLYRYFDNGSPLLVNLKIPNTDLGTEEQKPRNVGVPLMTLINHGHLAIQEMQITMQVEMNEIIEGGLKAEKSNDTEETTSMPYEWKPLKHKNLITVSTTSGKEPDEAGMVQITLKVVAEETPEGLAKLLAHLNKSL